MLLTACAASGGPGSSTPPGSITRPGEESPGRLTLHVFITGDCPVERVDQPCPREPYRASISIVRLDGSRAAEVQSDDDGAAQVSLPPGRYRLEPEQPVQGAPPFAAEQEINLRSGEETVVEILYDRGVR